MELIQLTSLDKRRLTGEGVDLYAVAFVFLPSPVDVVLLRLLSFENLFDGRLNLSK
jgi:hypothetical protein